MGFFFLKIDIFLKYYIKLRAYLRISFFNIRTFKIERDAILARRIQLWANYDDMDRETSSPKNNNEIDSVDKPKKRLKHVI